MIDYQIGTYCDQRETGDDQVIDVFRGTFDRLEKIGQCLPLFKGETGYCVNFFDQSVVVNGVLAFLADLVTVPEKEKVAENCKIPDCPDPVRSDVIDYDQGAESDGGGKPQKHGAIYLKS